MQTSKTFKDKQLYSDQKGLYYWEAQPKSSDVAFKKIYLIRFNYEENV